MASGITSYGSPAFLSALFGITSIPTQYWIALSTEQPGIDSDGDILAATEPPGAAGYARQSYASGGTNWAVNGPYLVNLVDVDFPVPTGDWGLLTHYVLCTASTSGELYAFGMFDNPYFAQLGISVLVPAGGIVIQLASLDVSIAV